MSFQSISDLFQDRTGVVVDADIQFYIENFLRNYVQGDALYCSVRGMGKSIKIRVHTPALAQQIILLERDLRLAIKKDLDCDIAAIRVMLE